MKRIITILVSAGLCLYLLAAGSIPVEASPQAGPGGPFVLYLPLVFRAVPAPTAGTSAATGITTTSATLNGVINVHGVSTSVSFQYGATTSYGSTVTAMQSPLSGSSDTAVSAALSGLIVATPYHYRVVAVNAGGTSYGADATFSTSPATATNLSTGEFVTCALADTGGVKCWGNNSEGELGDGTTIERHTPVNVVGLDSGVVGIANGYKHTCALTSGGGVKCWGFNADGELGDGTTDNSSTPVDVEGLTSGVAGISANGFHTCAVKTNGAVRCWGSNDFGELGDGTTTTRKSSVQVSGLTSGVNVVKAGAYHTCVLMNSGNVKCWGYNSYGQLGNSTNTNSNIPVTVTGLSGVTALTAGGSHTCVILTSGAAQCWGRGDFGQLGNAGNLSSNIPVQVTGLTSGIKSISAGQNHTCAVKGSGAAKCWGWNVYGSVGDGTTKDRNEPVAVSGLSSGVGAIRAGYHHSCALLTSGGIRCWGENGFGELGNDTTDNQLTPVSVIGFQ